jgi:hypothetical protein
MERLFLQHCGSNERARCEVCLRFLLAPYCCKNRLPPETCCYSNVDPMDLYCCKSRSLGGNLLLQQCGAFHSWSLFSIIFKPYSILDPTWGCPQNQKLTKTERLILFLELIPRISPFSEPSLFQHTQKFNKLQNIWKWPHLSRFCHWCHWFGHNSYSPFQHSTQNKGSLIN